jgi:DNA topoisomerase-1
MLHSDSIRFTKRQIKTALKNVEGSAKVVNLVYTSDKMPGIKRVKHQNNFTYLINGRKVADKGILLRIKSLAIPPAWENVWICCNENGHLQVTGYDTANRKQYRYHPLWSNVRKQTKFFRMLEFGKQLPDIRNRVKKDLAKQGLSREKVLATIISILDSSYLRIGNEIYTKLHGSYGITTLRDKHVKIEGSRVRFCFIGKKGIRQTATINNKKISNVIKRVRDLPGQHLFSYLDEDKELRKVDSGMVNDYIKEITGGEFTAKDFRTWAGSVAAIKSFYSLGSFKSLVECKRNVNKMYDMVAYDLGNTRNVVKNHYVHPLIVELYESKKLHKFFKGENIVKDTVLRVLKPSEEIMIKILENN